MLWLEPEFYIKIAATGQLLLDNRQHFVGRHAYKAFTDYAKGLLHRSTIVSADGIWERPQLQLGSLCQICRDLLWKTLVGLSYTL
jgi:hypothetical protein